eukprot:gene27331-biopygen8794
MLTTTMGHHPMFTWYHVNMRSLFEQHRTDRTALVKALQALASEKGTGFRKGYGLLAGIRYVPWGHVRVLPGRPKESPPPGAIL